MPNTWARNRYLDAISLGSKYSEYDWPHFPATVLNSTQREWEPGLLVGDGFGNIYSYVKYVDTTAAVAGCLVGLYPFVTAESEATAIHYAAGSSVASGYIDTDLAGLTENQHQNKYIIVDGTDTGAGAVATQPFIGEIFYHYATRTIAGPADKTLFQVKRTRRAEVGSPLGPGYPQNAAGTATLPKDNCFLRLLEESMFTVKKCKIDDTDLHAYPVGVCLGDVSIGSTTARYTWIQVFGIAPVLLNANATVATAGLNILGSTTAGEAASATGSETEFYLGKSVLRHTQVNLAGLGCWAFIDPYTKLR